MIQINNTPLFETIKTRLKESLPHSSEFYYNMNIDSFFILSEESEISLLLKEKKTGSIVHYSIFFFPSQKNDFRIETLIDFIASHTTKSNITFSKPVSSNQEEYIDLQEQWKKNGYSIIEVKHFSLFLSQSPSFTLSEKEKEERKELRYMRINQKQEKLAEPFIFSRPTERDIPIISERLKYNIDTLSQIVRQGVCVGIRDTVKERLIAWVMLHECNAIGCLYVEEDYRRQGLARACVQELLRISHVSASLFAYVQENDLVSAALFRSIDFNPVEKSIWIELLKV